MRGTQLTHQEAEGAPMAASQALAGHTSYETTATYYISAAKSERAKTAKRSLILDKAIETGS